MRLTALRGGELDIMSLDGWNVTFSVMVVSLYSGIVVPWRGRLITLLLLESTRVIGCLCEREDDGRAFRSGVWITSRSGEDARYPGRRIGGEGVRGRIAAET